MITSCWAACLRADNAVFPSNAAFLSFAMSSGVRSEVSCASLCAPALSSRLAASTAPHSAA
eukprot:3349777-Prymnesium_polylepis.1